MNGNNSYLFPVLTNIDQEKSREPPLEGIAREQGSREVLEVNWNKQGIGNFMLEVARN